MTPRWPRRRSGTAASRLDLRDLVAEALADGRHDADPASLVLELPVLVEPEDHLDQAIEALDRSGCAAVPVLQDERIVGWISYRTARPNIRAVAKANEIEVET